jgi:hypothetical protein
LDQKRLKKVAAYLEKCGAQSWWNSWMVDERAHTASEPNKSVESSISKFNDNFIEHWTFL